MDQWPFRLLTGCSYAAAAAFVLLVLLPGELAQPGAIRISCALLVVCLLLSAVVKRKKTDPPKLLSFYELLPFLLLLVYTLYQFSIKKEYHFGSDDSFYYAYAPSLILDGDLDFTNQYQQSGLPADIFQRITPTGALKNEFPIGPSLCWMPFFLIGHGLTKLLNAAGYSLPADGYSQVYLNSVIFGNTLYCFTGLILMYLFLKKHFSPILACAATLTIWMATPIYVYSTRVYLVSETVSMFTVALLLFMTAKYSENPGSRSAFFVGLSGALATMVRLHNACFLLIPLAIVAMQTIEVKRKRIIHGLWLLAGLLTGFFPQMAIWKILYGAWIVPAGQYLFWWKTPFVLEVLFSARKGLFPWSPILVFSCIGLILFRRKEKLWSVLMMIIFLINIYINSSQWDWWGSTAFGARRFTNCTFIFAVGLAAFCEFFLSRWGKKALILLLLILVASVNLNLFLTRAYRRGKLQYDHADRFSDVLQGKHYPVFKPAIYLLELPVQTYYRLRYGIPMYQPENEFFIGDDILYFQERHGELIRGQHNPIFGLGWEPQEKALDGVPVRCTTGSDAILNLPLFFKYDTNLTMDMVASNLQRKRGKVWVDLYLNDRLLLSHRVSDLPTLIHVPLFKFSYFKKMNLFKIHIRSENPAESPLLALQRLQFAATEFRRPENLTQ